MRRKSLFDVGESDSRTLVTRDMRLEVRERLAASGRVEIPVDISEVREVVRELVERGAESLAVCLLNSYANAEHERAVADIARDSGVPVSLSSAVAPEYGEYERWTTAVLNSYVMPRTNRYITELEDHLREMNVTSPLEIMQSNGGTLPAKVAAEFPIRLIHSGPSAGVSAAARIGTTAGYAKIITLDMGGTSADVAIVAGGEPYLVSEYSVDELPVRTVGIDVRSVGAGGGSIAWVDPMGSLQVGPRSAGADPGPACYGLGGLDATVTDADLMLGYIDPASFCGGTRRLNMDAAATALTTLGQKVGASPIEVATGIVKVAITRMAAAVRTIATQAGHDPRDCTLVAYGGAGPTHAAMVASELGIQNVLIPWEPALFSARGLLTADYRADLYRSKPCLLHAVDPREVSNELRSLEAEAHRQLTAADGDGEGISAMRIAEVCYDGQQDLVPITLERFPVEYSDIPYISAQLDSAFQSRYGFLPEERVPKLVRLRVSAVGVVPRPPLGPGEGQFSSADTLPDPESIQERDIVLASGASRITARVVPRDAITSSVTIAGPAIVEERYCSTIVLPEQEITCDSLGNMLLSKPFA
jgi:N-methylhydantoinase A